jgi:replicative DNA helicase
LQQIAGVRQRTERDTLTGRYTGDQAVQAFTEQWNADTSSETGGRVLWPASIPQLGAGTGGGQRFGWVVISGARTGVGKTWFGLDCALQAHKDGHRVAYFTLEMPAYELVERLAAMEGGGELDAIQTRRADWSRVTTSLEQLHDDGDRFVFLDGLTTPQRIRSELVGAAATGRPYRYLVIDTVNLVHVAGSESYRLGLNGLLRDLKALAVHYGCVIHLQAQLRRDDFSPNDAPKLTDLRESSAMEQTGDVVLLVHRPVMPDGNFAADGEVVLAKGRSSARKGSVAVRFEGFRFVQRVEPQRAYMAGHPNRVVA